MSIARLSLDFCSEPIDLYCPVCGQFVARQGVYENGCSHLLFFSDSSHHCRWTQAAHRELFDNLLQQEYARYCERGFAGTLGDYRRTLPVERIVQLAAGLVSSSSAFLLSLSTSDIGCGGMYNGSLHAIFDFRPEPRQCFCDRTGQGLCA